MQRKKIFFQGRFGDEVHRIVNGREIVSMAPAVVSQPRTEAQMQQRSKWPNIVAMYRAFKPYAKDCFEEKSGGKSDYNQFMGINLRGPNVYIPKQVSSLKGGVAATYKVSHGTLDSIEVEGSGTEAVTKISLGDLKLSDTTTVSQFAEAVVTNNVGYEYNDQIVFLLFKQKMDETIDVPMIRAESYRVFLDRDCSYPLRSVVGTYGFAQSEDGRLAVSSTVPQGCYAWIHSRKVDAEKTLVSSQRLVDNNPLLAEYMNDDSKLSAMKSYGLKEASYITPKANVLLSGSTASSGSESGGSASGGGGSEGDVDPDNPLG